MELRQYLITIRKWLWLIVLATVVATVASYVATRQQPPVYRATTTLIVGRTIDNPNPNSNEVWLGQQLAQTYAQLAQRGSVRQGAMSALDMAWLPEYTVALVPNTQLLEISVVDTNPERAAAVADALAEQLVRQSPSETDRKRQEEQAFVNQQLQQLRSTITETEGRITELQDQLAGMFSARQIADTQTQIAALEQKMNTYQANYASLLGFLEGGANTVRVVEQAQLPEVPIGPNKMMTILLAAAIGFLLALGAAFLLEYLDDTLKDPEDVKNATGLSTLGAIARIERENSSDKLVTLHEPKSPTAEAYRILRTNIQFSALDNPPRALLVASSHPAEGKSTTIANLAVVMAQQGQKVVLVDTDLRRPILHRLFQLPNNAGLTNALLQEQPTADGLMQPTKIDNLWVLTSGPLPPNPAELLGSGRFNTLIQDIHNRADVALFDSPPALAVTDAAILARQMDGVVLVVDAGATRRQWASAAVDTLNKVGANILGAVVNRLRPQGSGYYQYYYRRYYAYGDDADRHTERPQGWRRWLPGVGSGR